MSLLLLFNFAQAQASTGNDPKKIVLIGFDSAPGVDPPTWTDVSAYAMEGSTNRGRTRELDSYSAGTATITLRNEDRRFDPRHAAGPHFGKILPMKRLRIAAEYGGTVYSVFDGFIDSWDQQYGDAADAYAQVVITATDGFKPLSAADLPSSAYAREVTVDAPTHWWRLGEPAGATTAFDAGSSPINATVTTGAGVTFGGTGLVAREDGTSVTFTDGGLGEIVATDAYPTGTSKSVEFVFKVNALPAGSRQLFRTNRAGPGELSSGTVDNGGFLSVFWGGTAIALEFSPVVVGTTYHVVATTDGTTSNLYVDGVLRDTEAGDGNPGNNEVYIGGSSQNHAAHVLQEFAMYDTVLSATRIAAHANTVSTPWNGDSPGTRMGRILDAVGWPATLRDLDTGSSVLQSADITDQTALEHARKVEQSEFGSLYMTADGKVRLEGRNSAVNQASQLILDDQTPTSSYTNLVFDFSDQLIRNDVTISRNEGTAQNAQDATSIAAFLRHSYTRDGLIHNSDQVSADAADLLVTAYKDPLLRVTSLSLAPRGSPSVLFPHVLGRELTDRITVKRKPQGVGTSITQVSVLEGITHGFGPKRWTTTWQLSPALADTEGTELSFWQIGTAGHSELGTTNRLYF